MLLEMPNGLHFYFYKQFVGVVGITLAFSKDKDFFVTCERFSVGLYWPSNTLLLAAKITSMKTAHPLSVAG